MFLAKLRGLSATLLTPASASAARRQFLFPARVSSARRGLSLFLREDRQQTVQLALGFEHRGRRQIGPGVLELLPVCLHIARKPPPAHDDLDPREPGPQLLAQVACVGQTARRQFADADQRRRPPGPPVPPSRQSLSQPRRPPRPTWPGRAVAQHLQCQPVRLVAGRASQNPEWGRAEALPRSSAWIASSA